LKRVIIALLAIIVWAPTISLARAWEIERPGAFYPLQERTESLYTNGQASVGLGVSIGPYILGLPEYNGSDFVDLNITMTANSRIGITYNYIWQTYNYWWISENDLWCNSSNPGAGDDAVVPVDIPQNPQNLGYFSFRFYGGYGSAEYKKVYISTNGFVGFQSDTTPAPNPVASGFPNQALPNDLIAAVWTDLNIDASASIITGLYIEYGRQYFVIIWNNALHKASGQRLTFEIILQDAPQYYPADTRYSQSQIWISYKSVNSINTNFAMGIEDQQGAKGNGGLYSGSSLSNANGETCWFYQSSNSLFLKRLTMNIQDTNSKTKINVVDRIGSVETLRGYNVKINYSLPPPQPDGTEMFLRAVAGGATLLIATSGVGGVIAAGGFIVDTVLVGLDAADYLAYRQYSSPEKVISGSLTTSASVSSPTFDYVVDSSLSTVVHWIFDDTNPSKYSDHSLTITASLEYYEYTSSGGVIDKPAITTSVNLKIAPDHNNTPSTAYPIGTGMYYRFYLGGYDDKDYYIFHVDKGNLIQITANAASMSNTAYMPYFYVYLYNSSVSRKAWTGPDYYNSLSFTADSSGDWFILADLKAGEGFYILSVTVTSGSGSSSGGGGGGGCVAKGTKITMADGSFKLVEKVKPGDQVLGFDPSTRAFAVQNVLNATSTQVQQIENINNGALRLTPTDQPIYVKNSTYTGWIKNPNEIQIGWQIFDAKNTKWVTVTSISTETGNTWVYDFTTDQYQTYLANSFLLMDKGNYPK